MTMVIASNLMVFLGTQEITHKGKIVSINHVLTLEKPLAGFSMIGTKVAGLFELWKNSPSIVNEDTL